MIDECWLIPALSIGVSEDMFWSKTPKTIEPYFKAYEMKQKRQETENDVMAWKIGVYICNAIRSNIFVTGLADKDTQKQLPKYPEKPYSIVEQEPKVELTEKQKLLIEKFKKKQAQYGKEE